MYPVCTAVAPNPRLQRTPLRAPLSRKPLGGPIRVPAQIIPGNHSRFRQKGEGGANHSEFEHPWRFEHPLGLAERGRDVEAGGVSKSVISLVFRSARGPGTTRWAA